MVVVLTASGEVAKDERSSVCCTITSLSEGRADISRIGKESCQGCIRNKSWDRHGRRREAAIEHTDRYTAAEDTAALEIIVERRW